MLERHHKVREISRLSGISPGAVLPLLILLVAFGVRAGSLDTQGLWRDEVDQWRFALAPWSEMVQNFTRAGWNGPLFSPILRGWITLTGDSVYAMRYFSLLWGVVTVALVYTLGRRLVRHETALWAAGVAALSPYFIWYAQEIKMYTWVPALALLALYALERATVSARKRWWVGVLIATSLAFYSHILAALLIPVEVLWFLLHPTRHPRAWQGAVVVGLLLTLPYLPLLRWQVPILFKAEETGYPTYTLAQMVTTLVNGWSAGIGVADPFWEQFTIYAISFFGALALLGLGRLAWQKRTRPAVARILVWLALPLLAIWLVSLWRPLFTDRYLIWTAPAFYLLAGAGMAALTRMERRFAPVLLAGLLVLGGGGIYRQATYPIKPQFKTAVAYLETHRGAGTLVLFQIPYNRYVVDFYAEVPLDPWAEAPYTNWREPDGSYSMDEASLAGKMSAIITGHEEVWLVYSEAALWDDRELVKAWLDRYGQLEEMHVFQGVTLYHYSFN